jgi:hypothetical protein
MRGIELITGSVTAPGATLTPLTMYAGNSLVVRNAVAGSTVRILSTWAKAQAAGVFRFRSPALHDNVEGYRIRTNAALVIPQYPDIPAQILQPQDTLIAELSGSAVAGDIEIASLLVQYEDLPGIAARLLTADEVRQRVANVLTNEVTITTAATGGYSGQVPITTNFDLLRANTDYAILGIMTSERCAAIRVLGADMGNLGIGVPGEPTRPDLTGSFFMSLATRYNLPLVPVFNSANADSVLIDAAQDENAAAVIATLVLAELSR